MFVGTISGSSPAPVAKVVSLAVVTPCISGCLVQRVVCLLSLNVVTAAAANSVQLCIFSLAYSHGISCLPLGNFFTFFTVVMWTQRYISVLKGQVHNDLRFYQCNMSGTPRGTNTELKLLF